jgi:dynactin complex subunit
VKYVGSLPKKSGMWVGVELDNPDGTNDGRLYIFIFNYQYFCSFEGTRLFTCEKQFGIFVKINDCVTGNFPEVDLEDLL